MFPPQRNLVLSEKTNLLANSGFGVWSQQRASAYGLPVAVSSYTLGANTVVCTTANTRNLKLGKMIIVTVGDASLKVACHTITAITPNVSFQFNLEGTSVAAGDGGAITVYEANPGGVGWGGVPTTCGPDYWVKGLNMPVYRVPVYDIEGGNLGKGAFYSLEVAKSGVAREAVYQQLLKLSDAQREADVASFAGRDLVLGVSVYALTANNVKLVFGDGSQEVTSRYAEPNKLDWLEIPVKVGAFGSIDKIYYGFYFDAGVGDKAYVFEPMMVFGKRIGQGNYSPIPNEVVNCIAHISPDHLVGMTLPPGGAGTGKTFRVEGETSGQVPKNAKALSVALEGTGGSIGDVLVLFRNAYVDPLTQGIIVGCPINGAGAYGGMSRIQVKQGLEDSLYFTWFGSGSWSLVSIDICEVWL